MNQPQAAAPDIIEADLTWIGSGFESGVRVAVNAEGWITGIGALSESTTKRLKNRALCPGMINVHSHAFQRGLRGRGETFPRPHGRGSFWTWREAMYRLVENMDAATLEKLSVQAFREMLAAGVTTVGEFHYLHHDATGQGYAFDEIMLRAAKTAGIRIVLLNCYYKTGGIEQPLKGGQLRFHTRSPEEFWAQVDRLAPMLDGRTQSLGVAPHSIRAVPLAELREIHAESSRRGMVCHMHVEEQVLEVEDCVHHYHKPPMALINEHLQINPMFTAVHCTHTAAADMDDFLDAGGNVCINPLTEGNLGDGIPATPSVVRKGGHICFGSDSNVRLCWTEEMRWLEYVQRLTHRQRGMCANDAGQVGANLFQMATSNGARALALRAGRLEPRHAADFFTIDLTAPSLEGWTQETLLDAFIFGTGNQAIAETCVAGRWVHSSNGKSSGA